MAGTCKHVFGKDTIVSPSGMFGESLRQVEERNVANTFTSQY